MVGTGMMLKKEKLKGFTVARDPVGRVDGDPMMLIIVESVHAKNKVWAVLALSVASVATVLGKVGRVRPKGSPRTNIVLCRRRMANVMHGSRVGPVPVGRVLLSSYT